MNNLLLRRLGIVAAVLLVVGAVYFSKYLSSQKEPPKRKEAVAREKLAQTVSVSNEDIPTELEVQGELVAFDKIDIFAEVSGMLENTSRPFKVGSYFQKGNILLRVDDDEARLTLLSQKSSLLNSITQMMPDLKIDYPDSYQQWKNYLDQFDPEKEIQAFPKPLNDQEKFFIASRNLYTQYYNIKSAEERLSKYTLYAPFSGVITQTSINTGAVVRAGQKLGELMNTGNYELEATVPLNDLKYIKVGNPVELHSDDIEGTWNGRVKRINDQVDVGTQTVKVFIDVSGKDLKEGMYMKGDIEASQVENALRIPRKLLINQNSVYVVKDSMLVLEEVDVVKFLDETVIIRGLENGTQLLQESIPGAFDGMKVKTHSKNTKETSDSSTAEASPAQ